MLALNVELLHCASVHPPDTSLQNTAEDTTLTKRPEMLLFSCAHVSGVGKQSSPGAQRQSVELEEFDDVSR